MKRPLKVTFEVFALRRVGTQEYLPLRRGRGATNDEPTTCGGSGKRGPRLFMSRRGAISALSAWLKGPWEAVYETSDWDGKQVKVGGSPPSPDKQRRVEMEIVTFDLTER